MIPYGQDFKVVMTFSGVEPIDKVSFVRLGSTTHGFDQDQRYVPLVFQIDSLQANALIVEAPADGNRVPPGYYMLFLISDDGVPSIAKYVQLLPPVTP